MRIKSITCHDVYNHGASLQAYALQTYLTSIGHEAEIIDYKPDYLSGHFRLWSVDKRYEKFPLNVAYNLAKLPSRLIALKRKNAFDLFTHKHLRLTERYANYEQLAKNPPKADAFIAGSDQIWNTRFKNGTDPAFYLNFVTEKAKKLSYAASFAYNSIQAEHTAFVTRMLSNFDAISVREDSGVALLKKLGYNGCQVCDPVFLLNTQEWDSLALTDFSRMQYILVYDFERDAEVKQAALRLAKERNCRILSVGPYPLSYADKNLINVGPDVFVAAIRDAQCIISNSFHGSAFATIFNRDFFVIKRKDGLNDRMVNYLSHYGISNRLITADASTETLTSHIDFSPVNNILQEDILKSKQFLNHNLN